MVSDHTQANVIVVGDTGLGTGRAKTIALTAHLLSGSDNGINLIDLIHIRLVLHDEGQTFQTGAGIDRFLVKLTQ